jgi:hypothetical protein
MPNLSYERFDRILMSAEWEQKFPLSNVIALSRDISDHTPLLLDIGRITSMGSQHLFKFELGWLLRDGFSDMVKEIWDSVVDEEDKLKQWQSKIRRLRQHLSHPKVSISEYEQFSSINLNFIRISFGLS